MDQFLVGHAVQAGGRPLLRRTRRRPPPRRGLRRRSWSPAPPRRARSRGSSCRAWSSRAGSTAGAMPPVRGPRHARRRPARGAAAPETSGALDAVRREAGEGDRDGQPPRLRALADLPLMRAPLELPQLRRLADRPPRAAAGSSATTAPMPSRCPRACPDCGSTTLSRAGAGTERIEALLAERLGADAGLPARLRHGRRAGAHARILARFGEAPSGVLVGTQMVAKGHDFPEVTLSAILDADATLRFPDFRAEERTFAMVAQLAGPQRPRRGRGRGDRADPGAAAPPASSTPPATTPPASSPASWSGAAPLRYPPYSHLVRIELPPSRSRGSRRRPRASRRQLSGGCRRGSELLGPAPMFRVRSRHRRRLLIKARGPRGRRGRGARAWSSAAPPTARCARSRSASTSTRSSGRTGGQARAIQSE